MAIKVEYDNNTYGQTYTDSMGNEEYVPKGKTFSIVDIITDVDTGESYYVVECKKLGKLTKIKIPKEHAIDCRFVLKYANEGLDVSSSSCRIITEVFQQKEDEYVAAGGVIHNAFSVAGVKDVVVSGKETKVFAGAENPIDNSPYVGHLNLSPAGTASEWFEYVKELVKDSIELAFVIAAGFAPILLAVLKGLIDVENFIIHLFGFSSSGKTTALYLAISIYGTPDNRCKNGLISSWNGTKNALLKRLMNVNGLLMGLDEFSMSNERNISSLVYAISEGMERERCSREARLVDRLSGTYVVMSTGEASIFSKTNGNIGLTVRVLEMQDIAWTKSSEESESIKRFAKKNHGHGAQAFGQKLAEWLVNNSMDKLLGRYDNWREYYCSTCTLQARKERMSGRYALILLAADLLNEWFEFEIDCQKLTEFLIDNENRSGIDRDSYGELYTRLVACLQANYLHFSRATNAQGKLDCYKALEEWGSIEQLSEPVVVDGTYANTAVLITLPYFEKIVEDILKYEDARAIRKFLKKKGYSRCEGDRDTVRRVTNGVRNTYVAVYLPGKSIEFERSDVEWKEIADDCAKPEPTEQEKQPEQESIPLTIETEQ